MGGPCIVLPRFNRTEQWAGLLGCPWQELSKHRRLGLTSHHPGPLSFFFPPAPCCSYGDVYLAKWHNCEVAVKCLNPSLFFNGGDLSSINRAAIMDLVKEADMLGSLRHPNIVSRRGPGCAGRQAGGGWHAGWQKEEGQGSCAVGWEQKSVPQM